MPANPWANKSVLKGLGAGAKLLFGATGLTGTHLLRYLIKVRSFVVKHASLHTTNADRIRLTTPDF